MPRCYMHASTWMPRTSPCMPCTRTCSSAGTCITSGTSSAHHLHSYGLALQTLRKQLTDLGRGTSDTLDELERARTLEQELLGKLGWRVWQDYAKRWGALRAKAEPAPF